MWLLAEPAFEAGLDVLPFGIKDAEIYGVPYAAGRGNHVIAKRALFACPDAQNGRARAFVE